MENAWAQLTPFQQKVLRAICKIPKGEVRTYKWVAQRIGSPRAARAVGQALARNPHPVSLPCHRVVKSDGSIGGFQGSINPNSRETKKKIRMLKKEGVEVKNNKIDLRKFLFSV